MTLESDRLKFGRPETFQAALVRIPDRTHPKHGIDGGSYEHCAHLREHLSDLARLDSEGLGTLSLPERGIPLETEDIRLLAQVNSFYRDIENAVTADWSCIREKIGPWGEIVPTGDGEYRWWQITTFKPDVKLCEYRIYCIEMNDMFDRKGYSCRFDKDSKFEVVLAKEEEIKILKGALTKF